MKLLTNWAHLVAFGGILLGCINTVQGIKCWVCHSDTDPKCADPFDNTTLPMRECVETKDFLRATESPYDYLTRKEVNQMATPKLLKATMCRKIRQKIHGNWRTIRSCAFLGTPGEGTGNEHHCLYRRGTHDIYLEYCTCDSKDGCNGANRATITSFVYLFLSFVLVVWFVL